MNSARHKCLATIAKTYFSSREASLQENRSLATKPFRRTKVSISSLDVPGDEIVH
jgi:hypothetical protein